jgi:Delta7-sterol 5-desaturase
MDPVQPGWALAFATVLLFTTVRSGIFISTVFAWSRWSAFAARFRIFRLPFQPGQLWQEACAGAGVLILDAALFTTVSHYGRLRMGYDNAPTSILLHVILISLWLELWFYATHRLMHHPALYWIHAQHHVAKVTNPFTSLSFSLVERAVLVGGVLGFVYGLTLVTVVDLRSVILTGLVNYGLNVLGHSNIEFFPENFHQSRWRHWLITPTYHALHHARYRGHYALYSPMLDRWFCTNFADYDSILARTSGGQGMERLNERVSTPSQAAKGEAVYPPPQ